MQRRSIWGYLMTRSPPTKLLQMVGSTAGILGVGGFFVGVYTYTQDRARGTASAVQLVEAI